MTVKSNRYLQIFCLLACFLFAFAVTADPLLHDHHHDEEIQVECQFCKSEVPLGLDFSIADRVAYLPNLQQYDLSESYLAVTTLNYSSRAPPKI